MTESTDNNKQDNNNSPASSSDEISKASHDLSNAAEEAMRLSKQSQLADAEELVDDNGNTTNDLQQEALKAMQIQVEQQRIEEEEARLTGGESRAVFTENMQLRLESSESADPIIKTVDGELIVGRADNVTDYVPDIDLTPHGAYRLGLSRRHAIILREDDRVLVKDLNSRNGTFVNGTIIPGGGTSIIHDGDEVRFGNLAMQATFEG